MKVGSCSTKFILVVLLSVAASGPLGAQQLPATNLGKFVHQPGDNQYSDATQATRHAVAAPVNSPNYAVPRVSTGYVRTPAPAKPDITLEPIAADEPIPEPGFPPMPDRLEIPVAGGASTWTASSNAANINAGNAPTGGAINPSFHQHYGSVPAGAFMQNQPKPTYYKAQTPQQNVVNNAANNSNGQAVAAPTDAPPSPVAVSQSSTQDLSVPDDDFTARRTSQGKGVGSAMKMIRGPLSQFGGMAGVRF